MTDDEWLAGQFEASRGRLESVAYRMLGSHAEAEDAVQEVWLRLRGTDSAAIDNLGGWLTTVVSRLCLDRLRARRPAAGLDDADALAAAESGDPEDQAVLAESVGAALQIVLDSLGPSERVAFVLHDVFAVPFDTIAGIVDRSPEATRQLASRARRRVQGTTPAGGVDPARQRAVVEAFLRAARGGDFEALVNLLDPDVVLRPDEAALRMGALQPTTGARPVATLLSGGARAARLAVVDGLTGFVWAPAGEVRGVVQFRLDGDRVVAIDVTGDPERIGALEIVLLDV